MLMAIAFVVLNVLDAHLTKEALAMGAMELNPIAILWANMVAKGLAAVAIVAGLYFFKKQELLLPLSVGMLGICFWNFIMSFVLIAGGALLQPELLSLVPGQ
jgi:hypothetical protein